MDFKKLSQIKDLQGRGKTDVVVDMEQALRFLMYNGQEMDASLQQRLENAATKVRELARPVFVWRTMSLEEAYGTCGFGGNDLKECLEGSEAVTLLAVTLGAGIDRQAAQLGATNPLEALLFDACASSAVEQAANKSQDEIASQARSLGLVTRARFSPGYGDLELNTQSALLKALDAQRVAGIYTTSSSLLVPTKSITAIIGIFKYEKLTGSGTINPCRICPSRSYCTFLERGITCHGR